MPYALEITTAKIVFYTYFILRIELNPPEQTWPTNILCNYYSTPHQYHPVNFAAADDRGDIGDAVTGTGPYS